MRWFHYVGGFYSPAKFVAEARRNGVSRRVAPSLARSMSYGDVVTLLSWRGGKPVAFAEFAITRLTMEGDVAQEVGQELAKEGKARLAGGGGLVVRECGSYIIAATYVVDASLEEVVEKAMNAAKQLNVECRFMVGGPLTQVFDPPQILDPPPPFTRGFIKAEGKTQPIEDPEIVGIEGYEKRTRKERLDLQLTLGI